MKTARSYKFTKKSMPAKKKKAAPKKRVAKGKRVAKKATKKVMKV